MRSIIILNKKGVFELSKIYNNVTELIGKTPLLKLSALAAKHGALANILAKLEYFNPAGSIKDRVALEMINDAEKSGKLKEGSVIIEPTSGNTGIGLACVAACRGYRAIIVMPDTMSIERRKLIAAYGAEIVLTDGKLGMKGSIDKAKELSETIPSSIVAGQFVNPANPAAHIKTTGPEIWEDTDGKVDILVATAGTGGTVTGNAKYLKSKNPDIKVIAVEPAGSPVLSGGKPGPHKLQGIGAGFIPDVLDTSVIDEVMAVGDDESIQAARELARVEGILVGISSGSALCAAVKAAKRTENSGKNIVVILPDTGERYISTELFD